MHIEFCGYSFHTEGFYSSFKTGMGGYLFRLQTEGTCEVVVRGEHILIEKGDLLLVKPEDEYEILIAEGQNSGDYHLLFSGTWMDDWWNQSPKPTTVRVDLDDEFLSLWRFIISEFRRPDMEKNDALTNHLLRALCLSLERTITERSPGFKRPYVVTRMMRYIEEHAIEQTFTIDHVATCANLSVSRSVHLFKDYVGKTMIAYAQQVRLSAAIDQMTYTNQTLETIAYNCGFGAYSYFHRVFKKHYGVAPGEYRRKDS
ncbi:AraC family transcriptional regulator [Aquibacillus koreensis]|nr:AraC family transcriptional regulator [Aquibacillus koreensis]